MEISNVMHMHSDFQAHHKPRTGVDGLRIQLTVCGKEGYQILMTVCSSSMCTPYTGVDW
jgi:hypothetical protein